MKNHFLISSAFLCLFSISLFAADESAKRREIPFAKLNFDQMNIAPVKTGIENSRSAPTHSILKERQSLYWNGATWDSTYNNVYSYSNNNELIEDVSWYNTGTFGYQIESRVLYGYDLGGNLNFVENQLWDGSNWHSGYKMSRTYSAYGDLESHYDIAWNGSQWDTLFGRRSLLTYDANNKLIDAVHQMFSNGQYDNYGHEIIIRNSMDEIIDYTFQLWSSAANIWVNEHRMYNITWFDFSQNKYNEATIQLMNNGQLTDSVKVEKTYDINGNLLSETALILNGSIWENYQRNQSTYLNNLETSVLYQYWTGTWEDLFKDEYTYDSHDNLIAEDYFTFLNNNWEFDYGTKYTLSYDSHGNIHTKITEIYNINTLVWDYIIQYINLWDYLSSVPVTEKKKLEIYPNPATSDLNISGLDQEQTATVQIYSQQGQLLIHQELNSDSRALIDLSNLTSGMYILRISSGKNVETHKIIKQ